MIPILQQRGRRNTLDHHKRGKGVGFEEAQERLDNRTFFGFPHGTGVESGFTFRAFALAGSIFTGATGSIVFWTNGDTVKRPCFPPFRTGGQNYSHARTTRLHYNLLYIPPCYGLHR